MSNLTDAELVELQRLSQSQIDSAGGHMLYRLTTELIEARDRIKELEWQYEGLQ